MLTRYPQEIRVKLAKNIFLRGGGAKIDNIGQRIAHDLRRHFDYSLEVNLHVEEDPVLGNWKLMKRMMDERKQELEPYWITKEMFQNSSDISELFKPFAFTNA